MFHQPGSVRPTMGKLHRCKRCGFTWKSTGRHKARKIKCPQCAGIGYMPKVKK